MCSSDLIQDLTTAGHSTVSLTSSSLEITSTSIQIGPGWVIAAPDRGTVLINGDGSAALTKTGTGVLTITDTNTFVGNGSLLTNGMITLGNPDDLLVGDSTLTTLPVVELHGGTISGGTVIVRQADGSFVVLNGSGSPHLVITSGQTLGVEPSAAPVPEPGTATLFALGMLAASQRRRRKV